MINKLYQLMHLKPKNRRPIMAAIIIEI